MDLCKLRCGLGVTLQWIFETSGHDFDQILDSCPKLKENQHE